MRFALLTAVFLAVYPVQTAFSADGVTIPLEKPKAESPQPVLTRAQKLDALFVDLKKAKSQAVAEGVAGRIWEQWNNSESASINLLMKWSQEAMDRRSFPVALDFLDQVVVLQPAYAEGWNRRATLHFMMNNYSKSMADIEKTLELEPRHFGALAGMGHIFLALERKELALRAYERALDVYPMMRAVQKQVGEIADELSGSQL
jgi:tetratricopeptide (TPR) repeat protein